MSEELVSEVAAGDAALLELGVILGQNHAFGLIAGRCSAAQAESIRRLREEKLYKRCCEKWEDFCPKYLKISRGEADKTIKLWEEFGPTYFELSQLTRVSPETYRAIAPSIGNGVLHFNGEEIPLNADNSRKIAAAVAELRSAIPKKSPEQESLARQIDQIMEEAELGNRLFKVEKCAMTVVKEFEKIASHESLGASEMFLKSAVARVCRELNRVAAEIGAV
ncbi:MAG TPA: hypothetical protein VH640_13590 [Bryobacteraceae bacterium]|jgi:hypothetical protein